MIENPTKRKVLEEIPEETKKRLNKFYNTPATLYTFMRMTGVGSLERVIFFVEGYLARFPNNNETVVKLLSNPQSYYSELKWDKDLLDPLFLHFLNSADLVEINNNNYKTKLGIVYLKIAADLGLEFKDAQEAFTLFNSAESVKVVARNFIGYENELNVLQEIQKIEVSKWKQELERIRKTRKTRPKKFNPEEEANFLSDIETVLITALNEIQESLKNFDHCKLAFKKIIDSLPRLKKVEAQKGRKTNTDITEMDLFCYVFIEANRKKFNVPLLVCAIPNTNQDELQKTFWAEVDKLLKTHPEGEQV